jgi:hypothetical protein
VFVAAVAALHQLVFLSGDDFFYGAFLRGDFPGFWRLHAEHYINTNGRAVVHFLITVLLIFDVYLWRLLNPVIITLTLYFFAKTALSRSQSEQAGLAPVLVIGMGLLLGIDLAIARESLYWLVGSMNFMFPVFLLSWAFYLFDKSLISEKNYAGMPVLCLFAGATTEQAGLMTAGLLWCLIFIERVSGRQIRRSHYVSASCALGGYATVILAPGTMARVGTDGAAITWESLERVFRFFFTERSPAIMIVLTALSAVVLIVRLAGDADARPTVRKLRYAALACLCVVLAAYIAALLLPANNAFITGISVMLCICVTYVFALYAARKRNPIPLLFFLAAIGAQLMLAAAEHVYYRALLCSVLALLLPIMTAAEELGGRRAAIPAAAAGAFGVLVFAGLLSGYAANYPVHQHNLAQIRHYQSSPGTDLVRVRLLADDRYTMTPLQASLFYLGKMEQYYRLPVDSVLLEFPIEGFNRLFVNGSRILTNTPPVFHSGSSLYLVPLRNVTDALGYAIRLEGGSVVVIESETDVVTLSLYSGGAERNGVLMGTGYLQANYAGRLLVETRFFTQVLQGGFYMQYNEGGGADLFFDFKSGATDQR